MGEIIEDTAFGLKSMSLGYYFSFCFEVVAPTGCDLTE